MKLWRPQLGLLATSLLLVAACTAPQHPQLLGIFFDGVAPEAQPVTASTAEPASAETAARVTELYLAARSAPAGFRHKPYAERDCLSCHESQFSQKLRGEVPALCQSCHSTISPAKASSSTSGGHDNCLACHHPHESAEAALLIGTGWKLCGGCHEEARIAATPAHVASAGSACQSCHDPHGPNDPRRPRALPGQRRATPVAPRTSV